MSALLPARPSPLPVLAVRTPVAARSVLLPTPGESHDSVLLDPCDGVPAVHAATDVVVTGGPRVLRGPRVRQLPTAVIVTACRLAVASSAFVASDGGDCSGVLVGQVRYDWFRRGPSRPGRRRVRLHFARPDIGPMTPMTMTIRCASPELADRIATDLVDRWAEYAAGTRS